MKYWVKVGDRDFEVSVPSVSESLEITLDGQSHQVELWEGAPGIFNLLIDGMSYDVAAGRAGEVLNVSVGGLVFDVSVQEERFRRLATAPGATRSAGGKISVRAPMPGLVRQIDVRQGEEVDLGRRLLVLEAMKMENDISAPSAGIVTRLHAGEGQVVQQGDLLITLDSTVEPGR